MLNDFDFTSPVLQADGYYGIEYTASDEDGTITEANFLFHNSADDIYYAFNDANGDGIAVSDSISSSAQNNIIPGTYSLHAVSLRDDSGNLVQYYSGNGVYIEYADGTTGSASHSLTFEDLLLATTYSDNSDFDNGFDDFWGTSDNDIIYLLAGDDVVHGTLGNDTIIGGNGNDHVVYTHSGLNHVWINASSEDIGEVSLCRKLEGVAA